MRRGSEEVKEMSSNFHICDFLRTGTWGAWETWRAWRAMSQIPITATFLAHSSAIMKQG